MLAQLVCVDRRYQRMNAFNIKEIQSVLKRKFFNDLQNSVEFNSLLDKTMISLKFKTNDHNYYNSHTHINYNLGLRKIFNKNENFIFFSENNNFLNPSSFFFHNLNYIYLNFYNFFFFYFQMLKIKSLQFNFYFNFFFLLINLFLNLLINLFNLFNFYNVFNLIQFYFTTFLYFFQYFEYLIVFSYFPLLIKLFFKNILNI